MVDGYRLVVPLADFETPLKPLESVTRVWAAIDEVADAEEAIASRIESELGQGPLNRPETTVHVADNEIAPALASLSTRRFLHDVTRVPTKQGKHAPRSPTLR